MLAPENPIAATRAGIGRAHSGEVRLFRGHSRALDHLRDLLVLLRHLREAVFPQAFRPRPVPLRRRLRIILAQLLGLVLARHFASLRSGAAQPARASSSSYGPPPFATTPEGRRRNAAVRLHVIAPAALPIIIVARARLRSRRRRSRPRQRHHFGGRRGRGHSLDHRWHVGVLRRFAGKLGP